MMWELLRQVLYIHAVTMLEQLWISLPVMLAWGFCRLLVGFTKDGAERRFKLWTGALLVLVTSALIAFHLFFKPSWV